MRVTDPDLTAWEAAQSDLDSGSRMQATFDPRAIRLPDGLELKQTVTIAVIDSGFDLGQPSINYVDPALHFNVPQFNRRRRSEPELQGSPYDAGPSRRPHGTGVAGAAAAIPTVRRDGNRAVFIQGMAPGFPVMPIKVAIRPTSKQIAAGIAWAVERGARVINISLKVLRQPVVSKALEDAWSAGVLLCAAAGNYSVRYPMSGVDFPASHPLVIAVGATDERGRRKRIRRDNPRDWGSQYGPELDVVAPGVNVATVDDRGPSGAVPGDYSLKGRGTSIASPQVAGLAALIMGIQPELSNQQVRDLIEANCIQLSGYQFASVRNRRWEWNREVGYGEISREHSLDHLARLNRAS